jgi:hypothetical protein
MTQMPILHLRLTVEAEDGTQVTGVSASGLPPLWFDKGASKTHADNINDLSVSLRLALEHYLSFDPAPVYALHRVAEPTIRAQAAAKGLNDLTAGFGIALVDLAMVDAACRHAQVTFHTALKINLLGFGDDLAPLLPAAPLERIALRHTVGLFDPIVASDVTTPIGDGLPETLEDVVRQYKTRYFKVKISGDADASRDRLRRIASVLDAQAGDYRVNLDGNEQFPDMGKFASFMRNSWGDPALKNFWQRMLWLEQPVAREAALDDSVIEALKEVDALRPVIIDESDGSDESVERALKLGYRGISAKNCKGVFRTLHSYRLTKALEHRNGSGPVVVSRAILSSEDLSNVPIVPLHQDFCVAAALGIPHSERNGHHYVVGFQYLSEKERESAQREYPSLYRTRENGPPVVRIDDGFISMKDINQSGFGTVSEPDWDNMEPVRLPQIPEDVIQG